VNLLVLVRELGRIDVVIITAVIIIATVVIVTTGVTTIGVADRVILRLGVGVVRAGMFLGQFSLLWVDILLRGDLQLRLVGYV
jgi:hypothetical protein